MGFFFTGNDQTGMGGTVPTGETVLTLFGWAAWYNKTDSQAEIFDFGDTAGIRINGGVGSVWMGYYHHAGGYQNHIGTTILVDDGVWRSFAYVLDPGNSDQRVYLDGILENSYSNSSAIDWLSPNMAIGKHVSASAFDFAGGLAELAIWNRALDSDEILKLSQGYSPLFFHGLWRYWPFIDNGSDLIVNNHLSNWGEARPGYGHPKIIYPNGFDPESPEPYVFDEAALSGAIAGHL